MTSDLNETTAQEYYSTWERLTNRFGSEGMTPHIAKAMDREHPTLRQQMVAQMVTLLNLLDTTHSPDDRDAASCAFLVRFQEWLKDYEEDYEGLYISREGEVKFPFI